ncbi:Putative diguanylate cyclase (GGDEF)/phosphodiesterase (EAL) precursor with PAS sensor; Putative two-component sensor histidine kinase [Magnetospirillum molischianum DSM 120]|uniref:Putative diguanylate cyclase (GGDEF)/phosphodiesterase (EAL) with PAS sensor Putative two-component sensor histidine kinase n=2 Tax=Magnetospirillum molischianum TaxID=1083 RepID=H8FVI9_MAGML|nr:Putative diguanylate cyclase (GGDEF)/phosphodiesterase (EAL) precursor with PAS sensor; Putative two-component sensor histidine kinase [Magnetospirillum molischianum DSM 120]
MAPPSPSPVLSVLVVEDNPGDARLVKAYLEEDQARPFAVTCVSYLSKALEFLKTHPVDVVLLDLSLPDSFGLDGLAQLRQAAPTLPVVVLTGTVDERLALEALRQGAQDYLVKGQGEGDLVRRAIRYAIGRSRADAALRESEARFRALFDNAGAGVILTDAEGRYLHCNPAFCAMVGYSESELHLMTFRDISHPDDRDSVNHLYRQVISGEIESCDITKRYLNRDGTVRWGRLTVTPIRDTEAGQLRHAVAVVEDVTETKRLEDHMRLAATVFENTGEGLFVTDERRRIIHVNPAFTVLTGYAPEDVLGKTPRILASGRHPPEFYDRMNESLVKTGRWQGEVWNRRKTGEMFAEWLNIAEVRDEHDRLTHYVAVFSDITSRKEDEERLSYQANHDPLTRLPNRTLFQERLSRALTRAHRNHSIVTLLFIDLDHFKQVNDTLGHLAGDCLLQQVAERLSSCVRQGDTIARLAGDEFTVILEDVTEARDSAIVAQKILSLMAEPFDLQGHEARISSSIGVALYPNDGDDPQTLIKLADAAMYQAKNQGRNACRFHSESVYAQAFERLGLENSLRLAVERNEFELYYQPVFAADTGRVMAVEALLRWHHPEIGLMTPDHFLPLAEETGLIFPIGRLVLESACRQTRLWLDQGIAPPRVCLNLSARQFHASTLADEIAAALAESNLPAAMLEFDLPESCLTEKGPKTDSLFTSLKTLGIGIAIDDFGSGHSSFSLLRQMRTDTLKISQDLVRDPAGSSGNTEVIQAIVAVAHGLHIRVVAPGIETVEQLTSMIGYECDLLQGFLFSPPLPTEEMTAFLRQGIPPPALANRI